MNRRTKLSLLLISGMVLLFLAGDHPLLDHWGDVAQSGDADFGSKWVHTDVGGVRYGLWGESASADARGVFGHATSTSGSGLAIGVYGESDSPTGRGVHGYATAGTGKNFGVTGSTYSTDIAASGVYGFNNRATAGSTRGVQGTVKSTYGYGVIGFLDPDGPGESAGVHGANYASSGQGAGIEGTNSSPSGWAGSFFSHGNGVKITAATGKVGLVVLAGTKNASVPTSDGDRLLYSEESTEVWFSDYGIEQLKDGSTWVEIDPTFAETVDLEEPYHVFLQAYGDTNLYVYSRTATSFEVRATRESIDLNAEFSYRIVAKRLGFEELRLELAPWVTDDQPYYQPPPIPEPPPLTEDFSEVD